MKRLIDICRAVKQVYNILKQLTVYSGKIVIVVEGVRDRDWLLKLGFSNGSIIVYNFSRFENNVIDYRERGYKYILILADFDSEGRRLEKLIRRMSSAHGYNELKNIREALSKYAYFFGYTIESYVKNYLSYFDTCKKKGLL